MQTIRDSLLLAAFCTQSMHGGELLQLSDMLSEATKLEDEKLEQKRVHTMGPGDIGPQKPAIAEEQ